jgi:hypothetical protein
MLFPLRSICALACGMVTLAAPPGRCGTTSWATSVGVAELFDQRQVLAVSSELQFEPLWLGLRPFLSAQAFDVGASYVGSGFALRAPLGERWQVTISSGAGYYRQGSSRLALGRSLEFLSEIELTRDLSGRSRIGLRVGHLSNGSQGAENPGTEMLKLTWTRHWR